MSNHAHRRAPVDLSPADPRGGLWKRTRSFLAWFFAPRLAPDGWKLPRFFGLGRLQAGPGGVELHQIVVEDEYTEHRHDH